MSIIRKTAGLLAMSVAPAALAFAAPAQAALTLVGTFSGNQCTGVGDITNCYASGTTAGTGALSGTQTQGSSPGILRFDPGGNGTGTTTNFSDWITKDATTGDFILNFNYTGSEVATYIGVFQGGSGLNCSGCNNTYQLFYDGGGITSGTIDLNSYFTNEKDQGVISHIDLFDHGGAPVPEPATWAMMLLGFAGIGWVTRRGRKPRLAQLA